MVVLVIYISMQFRLQIEVLLNCCFFRVILQIVFISSFDKVVNSLEYPYAMLLNLFIFELKYILNSLSKADSIIQLSSLFQIVFQLNIICHSLCKKCFSIKMSLKCVSNEQVFNNDIVMADSSILCCVCDLKQLSVVNLSYSLFADSLTFMAALLQCPIKCNSLSW